MLNSNVKRGLRVVVDLSTLLSPVCCNTSCFVSYDRVGHDKLALIVCIIRMILDYPHNGAKWTAGDSRYDGHRDSGIVLTRYNTNANLYRYRHLVSLSTRSILTQSICIKVRETNSRSRSRWNGNSPRSTIKAEKKSDGPV